MMQNNANPPQSGGKSPESSQAGDGRSFAIETPQISLPKGGGAIKGFFSQAK
jgi:hypothetical protein